jgi:hypothetical protein
VEEEEEKHPLCTTCHKKYIDSVETRSRGQWYRGAFKMFLLELNMLAIKLRPIGSVHAIRLSIRETLLQRPQLISDLLELILPFPFPLANHPDLLP